MSVNSGQMGDAEVAWRSAFALADLVRRGGRPRAVPATVMLRPGEVQHGSLAVDCQLYYAMDVEYSQSYVWGGGLLTSAIGLAASAAGNASARHRAARMAQAQWRPQGRIPAIVTSQRLLLMIDHQWISFEYGLIVGLHLDLPQWTAHLHFEGASPLRLHGPWVPWLCVVISATASGTPWPPGTALPGASAVPGPQPRPQLPPGPA